MLCYFVLCYVMLQVTDEEGTDTATEDGSDTETASDTSDYSDTDSAFEILWNIIVYNLYCSFEMNSALCKWKKKHIRKETEKKEKDMKK